MKLLFVTDIHGSEVCFRKFFSAVREYRADVALLVGDLSGKVMVPIKQKDQTYTCSLMGEELVAKNKAELADMEKRIANVGYYSYVGSQTEIDGLQNNPEKGDEVFQKLIIDRLGRWMKLADEKLRDSVANVYIGVGNDDPFIIDSVLNRSERMRNLTERVVDIGGYEVVTTAFSNPTPWNTPRECSEEELRSRIDQLASKVKKMDIAIFNFHVPPYGSLLDVAPELKDMEPQAGSASNVGSTAVAESIKKYQPLLGLHGHIHESKAAQKLGRTLCVNPGSEYSEGILRGIILTLENGRVKNYIFTSG
jgi:Icc-related predicted phosphoesterase